MPTSGRPVAKTLRATELRWVSSMQPSSRGTARFTSVLPGLCSHVKLKRCRYSLQRVCCFECRLSVKECVGLMISDQVKGFNIDTAPKGFQCFYDSKQLLLSHVTTLLSTHHVPRPGIIRPTFLDIHSTKIKARSITHQVKDGAALPMCGSQNQQRGSGKGCLHFRTGILASNIPVVGIVFLKQHSQWHGRAGEALYVLAKGG